MALEIRDLQLVRTVAAEGSLTRAGNVLFLTQSALSRQLADLERRLGAALFQRQGRRMVPTPAGERLLESAAGILASVARAEEEVRDRAREARAVLRFSTECYTCYHWVPALLMDYQALFPDVELRMVAAATRRPLQALLRGQLDAAIISDPVRDRRVRSVPLFGDEMVAVVAPTHPWAGREFVDAPDFATEHLILYNIARSESTLFREVLDPAGVTPARVSRVELTEAILELVRAGLGVGVLARWAVAPYVRAGGLTTVRIGRKGIQRQWSCAIREYREVPDHLTAFVELLGGIGELQPRAGWYPADDATAA